jgi:hypothetical protein
LALNSRSLRQSLFSERGIHDVLGALDQPSLERLGRFCDHVGDGFWMLGIVNRAIHHGLLFLSLGKLVNHAKQTGNASQGIMFQSSQATLPNTFQTANDFAKSFHNFLPTPAIRSARK